MENNNYSLILSHSLILIDNMNSTIDAMGDGRLSEYTELEIVHRLLLNSIDTLEEAVESYKVSMETGASGNRLLIEQSLTEAEKEYLNYEVELNRLLEKNDITLIYDEK